MKRSKNRQLLLFLFVLLSVGACAVGAIDALNYVRGGSQAEHEIKKHSVAVITKSTTSAFWKSVSAGANAAGTEYNLTISFEGPASEEDYETQNRMIGKAVENGAEVIVFSAVDYNANRDAINQAAERGVKIVVIDSDVNSDRVSCRIGTENYQAGRMAGKAALSAKDDPLNIGIVNFDKNTANGQQRELGFRDAAALDPRARIADAINVISTTESAQNETVEMLSRHPEINVIATFNEWTSLGVGYAIKQLDLGERTTVVAFDSNAVSVGMLETGEVDALIVQDPYAMGYLGVECAYNLINGIPRPSPAVDTTTTLVTRDYMFTEESQRVLFPFD